MSHPKSSEFPNFFDLELLPTTISIEEVASSVNPPVNVNELIKAMDSGWPWPLDAVQKFFEDLYEKVVSIPSRVINRLAEGLRDALSWIWDHIFLQALYYTFDVLTITHGWFRDWREPWRSIARLLSIGAAMAYKSTVEALSPAFDRVISQVSKYFDGAAGGIFDAIRNAFSPIFDPLMQIARALHSFATERFAEAMSELRAYFTSITRFYTEKVGGFYDFVRGFIERSYSEIVQGIRSLVTETIPRTLNVFFDRTREAFEYGLKRIHGFISETVLPQLRSGVENVWSTIQSLLSDIVSIISGYYDRLRGYAERGDIIGIITESMPVMGLSIAAAVAVDLVSVKVAGTGIDPELIRSQVAKLLDSLIDPRLFTSIFLAIAVQKPLEHAVRYSFRTEIPSPGDLMKFYSKGWISRDDFYAYMARHGYLDFWISLYEKSLYAEPRLSEVFTAYARGIISREEYERWLEILNILREPRPGMRVPDIAIFEESLYRTPSPFLIVQAIESGALSEDELKDYLKFELIHPRFIDIMSRALLFRALRDELSQAVRALIDDYADLAVSKSEFEEQLRGIGKRPHEIELLSRVGEARRRRSIRKMFVRAALDSYLNAYIAEEELTFFLNRLGLESEAISSLLELARVSRDYFYIPRKTADERNALASRYIRMYIRGLISEDELYAKLSELMFSEDEIRLRLEIADIDKLEELRKMREEYLRELIRQGFISRTDAMDYCTRYIASVDYCREYVDLLFARFMGIEYFINTRDERSALANSLVRAYLRGLFTREDLENRLRALRFTDEEIRLRIERAEIEEMVREVEDELKALDSLLKRAEITLEDYVSHAVALGIREDVARRRAARVLTSIRK
ncbi:MAG: hypothetical protein QW579_04720 [Desulfurococcaceae archaeon]